MLGRTQGYQARILLEEEVNLRGLVLRSTRCLEEREGLLAVVQLVLVRHREELNWDYFLSWHVIALCNHLVMLPIASSCSLLATVIAGLLCLVLNGLILLGWVTERHPWTVHGVVGSRGSTRCYHLIPCILLTCDTETQ